MPAPPLPAHRLPGRRLRLLGAIIAGLGLLAAAAVFLTATAGDTSGRNDGEAGYRVIGGQAFSSADSAAADRQSERLGGKALVRTAAFDRWLRTLLHGQRLAATLAVSSLLVAVVCGCLASLADEAEEVVE